MNRVSAFSRTVAMLSLVIGIAAVTGSTASAQNETLDEESLEGVWVSNVKVGDVTITRRLLIDVEDSDVVDDVLTEAGVFRYERTDPKGTLIVEGPFRHTYEDGRGVIELRSGDVGLRYGRRVAIDEIERPTDDTLRIEFVLWQAVSCSCAVSIDKGDIVFTSEADVD